MAGQTLKLFSVYLCVLMLFCGVLLFAQEPEPADLPVSDAWPSAVGYYANHLGGGLSWQYWKGITGLAVGTGLSYQPESGYGYYLDYHLQLQLARRIHSFQHSPAFSAMLYAVAMLGHRGITSWETGTVVNPETEFEEYVMRPGVYAPKYFAGAGLGVEQVLFNHLSHTLDFMYLAEFADMTVTISVGTGLRFRY